MAIYEKLVLVTRTTRLEELIDRFNTQGQAKFYIEHAGGDFSDYEREHDAYQRALDRLRRDLDFGMPRQFIDRSLVPTYMFGPHDLVVTLGQDGLVANVAKYAGRTADHRRQPRSASASTACCCRSCPTSAKAAAARVLDGKRGDARRHAGRDQLDDGQRLLAFNDLFIGTQDATRLRAIASASARRDRSAVVERRPGQHRRRIDRLDVVGVQHGGRRHRLRRRPDARGRCSFTWEDPTADFRGARAVHQPPFGAPRSLPA